MYGLATSNGMEENNPPISETTIQTEPQPVKSGKSSQNNFLPLSILIAAVLVAGAILYSNGQLPLKLGGQPQDNTGEPAAKVKVELSANDHVLGSNEAKVTIVEFSDFQCPFCRIFFTESFAKIKTQYIDTGKVKFAYKHFPLEFHSMATPAAQASECASEQGKFWEMHDKVYQEQAKLGEGTIEFTVKDLKKWATQIRLNASQFNSCLDSNKYSARIDADNAYGVELGVRGTPTFFVNGNRMVGAQPFASFQALIDKEL